MLWDHGTFQGLPAQLTSIMGTLAGEIGKQSGRRLSSRMAYTRQHRRHVSLAVKLIFR